MKSGLLNQLLQFFLLTALLAACSKQPLEPIPTPDGQPQGPQPKSSVSFVVNQPLEGGPYHSSNLTAVVTIVNKENVVVVDEKQLSLNLDGSIQTESLLLSNGQYKLTRFRLVYGSVQTHFVSPITGSPKASGVQKPLELAFTMPANSNKVGVDVLKVAAGEEPGQYGYPAGTFDNHQEENNPYLKVKIKASMQIGDVLYDSLSAALTLTTWNQQGEMTTSYLSLKAGINEVPVLKTALRYKFAVSKWGTTDEMTLERQQVDTVTVYSLGGSKAARKLKSELTYVLVNGRSVPESKIDYVYNLDGRLFRVYHYQRDAENKPYLAMAENFHYVGNRLDKITRLDGKNVSLGSTSFRFDQQGKVIRMVQEEAGQVTNAVVDYHYGTQPGASVHYSYSDQTYTVDHSLSFHGGNYLSSNRYIAGELSETSLYEFDGQINPYIHLNWPDLTLSKMTKNNLVKQSNYYYRYMPQTEPYDYTYTYDGEGYPKEVVKKWRLLPSRQYTKTTRTVFEYE